MAAVSFKGVGRKSSDIKKHYRLSTNPPVGIKTPLALSDGVGGIFEMHYEPKDQIKDNLKNLIATNHGERLGRYDYGANLRPLLFEMVDRSDFEVEAMRRIKAAVADYLSFIELLSFEIIDYEQNDNGLCRTNLRIIYNIPRISSTNEVLIVNLDAGG